MSNCGFIRILYQPFSLLPYMVISFFYHQLIHILFFPLKQNKQSEKAIFYIIPAINMTLWKWQNYGDSKNLSGCQGLVGCQSLSHVQLCNPTGCSLCPWNSLCKNTGVGCHYFPPQGIFLTQGLNLVSCISGKFFFFNLF